MFSSEHVHVNIERKGLVFVIIVELLTFDEVDIMIFQPWRFDFYREQLFCLRFIARGRGTQECGTFIAQVKRYI